MYRKKKSHMIQGHVLLRLLIILIVIIAIVVFSIRKLVLTEQYYWSNDLISAIEQNDEQGVKSF